MGRNPGFESYRYAEMQHEAGFRQQFAVRRLASRDIIFRYELFSTPHINSDLG